MAYPRSPRAPRAAEPRLPRARRRQPRPLAAVWPRSRLRERPRRSRRPPSCPASAAADASDAAVSGIGLSSADSITEVSVISMLIASESSLTAPEFRLCPGQSCRQHPAVEGERQEHARERRQPAPCPPVRRRPRSLRRVRAHGGSARTCRRGLDHRVGWLLQLCPAARSRAAIQTKSRSHSAAARRTRYISRSCVEHRHLLARSGCAPRRAGRRS